MVASTTIRRIRAREIFDSRGRPTVEVDVELDDGTVGRASVPSGASTGAAEACELRDGDPARHAGLGVRRAVAHVNESIAAALAGTDVCEQRLLDQRLLELDGTERLERLGANAILGVSLACCRAAAQALGEPLYRRIAALSGTTRLTMPLPMVNILSGGLHAGRGMDVQDFLAIPVSAQSMQQALELILAIRASAAALMAQAGLPTLLADEGGLSPGFETADQALELMVRSIERAGLRPGTDVQIAIDVAATSLKGPAPGLYRLARENTQTDSAGMIARAERWVRDYPVASIEDPLDEDDWDAWKTLSDRLGASVQLVGDDLFTTNPHRVRRGIDRSIANGVLIKLNQNGTLTGTLDVIAQARAAGYTPVVSARSGETEDPFIADLAVGTAAGQIKIGSVRCGERMAKYNQLLRIEGDEALPFAGRDALSRG
jgi:enolase